jgi:hypothetical protein
VRKTLHLAHNAANNGETILFGKPRPLLPDGKYHSVLVSADWAWTKRYKRNQAKFVFDSPLDYYGPAYSGDLCALCPLAGKEGEPYAAPGGRFYELWSHINGCAPMHPALTKASLKQMFEGRIFQITVKTVKRSWKAKKNEQDLPSELWYSIVETFRLDPGFQQPAQPSQPGNQDNHHNPLTSKPEEKPCNQITSKPPSFPQCAREEVSGVNHADSSALGGTDATTHSVPRSQTCYVHKASTTWWRRSDGDLVCERCHPRFDSESRPA